jgi:glycolate oxidase iron-sulfur subunit
VQTGFSLAQLADPDIDAVNGILRACVHCGFCNATCPTYVLTGDELDSPRGRIYLIKIMLEDGRAPASADMVHIDRCLSCLSCMTTCPSGVNYMHLVDYARIHMEKTAVRPVAERALRRLLGWVLPNPGRFRLALALAGLARPFAGLLPGRLGKLLALAGRPAGGRAPAPAPGTVYPAEGERAYRVALLTGCVQDLLAPAINAATVRLLTRHGCEVTVAAGSGCCGALNHHLGQAAAARRAALANIGAWTAEISDAGLDAIIVNASGCGTMVKDYGFLFRADPELAGRAAAIAGKTRDISEFMAEIGLKPATFAPDLSVVYQAPCSLMHGQKVVAQPAALLGNCGFETFAPPEPHLCCGSAGTYNILQSGFADRLRERKVECLVSTGADAVATGNIGCMMQLAPAVPLPVVHVAELLDWATGGPEPAALKAINNKDA